MSNVKVKTLSLPGNTARIDGDRAQEHVQDCNGIVTTTVPTAGSGTPRRHGLCGCYLSAWRDADSRPVSSASLAVPVE